MNMLAREYIERVVAPEAQPFAQVFASYARKGVHIPLKPDQPVPDENENVNIFIHVNLEDMPAILVPDPDDCADGWVCEDHPDRPMGHDGCAGAGMPCPVGCEPVKPEEEEGEMAHADKKPKSPKKGGK